MRRVIAVVLVVSIAGGGLGAQAQTPAPGDTQQAAPYVPPVRGAPGGRSGGASRDIQSAPNPAAPVRPDAAAWQSLANSNNPADFEAFLMRYPNSDFAANAEQQLMKLRTSSPPGK